jgi:hypothetical protein
MTLRLGVRGTVLILAWVCLLVPSEDVAAQTTSGRRIAYEGRLQGIATGTPTTLVLELFAERPGLGIVRVWGPELHVVVPDAEGRFATLLGVTELDTSPSDGVADLDQIDPRELELQITVRQGAIDTRLAPRQPLVPAFHASSADRAVVAESVAAGSIDAAALAPDAVTSAKIEDGAVTGAHVAVNQVGAPSFAVASVVSADIVDRAIGLADMGVDAVGSDQMQPSAVGSNELVDGAFTAVKLANESVTNAKLALSVSDRLRAENQLVPFEIVSLGEWRFCALNRVEFQPVRSLTEVCSVAPGSPGPSGNPSWTLTRNDNVAVGVPPRFPARCEARCF